MAETTATWFPDGLPPEAEPWAADLLLAGRAAREGGRAVAPYYERESLAVEEKDAGDPVTEADRAANRAIIGLLRRQRPDDGILSEESEPPPPPARGGRLWVVDPLDGTKEFIARIGEFCVMVGLARQGTSRVGALFRPDPGALYLGISDVGAWVVEPPDPARPLRLSPGGDAGGEPGSGGSPGSRREDSDRAALPLRVIHSRSHWDERIAALADGLGEVDMVPCGSVGVKCAHLAAGDADLYVHPVPYLKEWDTCAPEAVLRGAGGRITDCRGGELAYGKARPTQPGGLFAGRPDVWARVREAVREIAPSDPAEADGTGTDGTGTDDTGTDGTGADGG